MLAHCVLSTACSNGTADTPYTQLALHHRPEKPKSMLQLGCQPSWQLCRGELSRGQSSNWDICAQIITRWVPHKS